MLKGFWGRYFEGASFNPWQRATSGYQDTVVLRRAAQRQRWWSSIAYPHWSTPSTTASITSAWTRRRCRSSSSSGATCAFAVTGIWRDYGNFINSVNPLARYTPTTVTNRLTNQPMTLYRWANRSTTDEDYFIRNVDGFQYLDGNGNPFATAEPDPQLPGRHVRPDEVVLEPVEWAVLLRLVEGGGHGQQRRHARASPAAFFENPNTLAGQLRWPDGARPPARMEAVRRLYRPEDRGGAQRVLSRDQRDHLPG